VRADLDDLPAGHDRDPAGVAGGLQAVRDGDDRAPGQQGRERLLGAAGRAGILAYGLAGGVEWRQVLYGSGLSEQSTGYLNTYFSKWRRDLNNQVPC
jgi:hypothetical protein